MARSKNIGGMIASPQGGVRNFHNQGVVRSRYQGPQGSGFTVEFFGGNAQLRLQAYLEGGVIAIRQTSMAAVVSSTDEIKQKLRAYLDAHFTGSAMHGNNHRRVSNAAVQSANFDSAPRLGYGQGEAFGSVIYSKFGIGHGPASFVDFLLLHVRGGTVTPRNSDWLRIPNRNIPGGAPIGAQTGNFESSGSSVFFVKSADGTKLFQLRRFRSGKKTQLLATLMKSIVIKPTLAGVDAIAAERGATFDRHFDAHWAAEKARGGIE